MFSSVHSHIQMQVFNRLMAIRNNSVFVLCSALTFMCQVSVPCSGLHCAGTLLKIHEEDFHSYGK
jgi:hypothetical protein